MDSRQCRPLCQHDADGLPYLERRGTNDGLEIPFCRQECYDHSYYFNIFMSEHVALVYVQAEAIAPVNGCFWERGTVSRMTSSRREANRSQARLERLLTAYAF